ncbi:tetratricopeptide repeat protein [Mucilaginibacter auburnensis]|uniref:Tetratricopeptide repeat protein n=1 Tax=Mucilaginibacter auburnensis TaxID=1457233 RepID=A0A2H9VPH8_9SPHI|nr:tetratricopeptide repeat protein [Mucilaginibacter auburnensis]PJJ80190.1 tetratricopeptide repeat protein [Mucilaginibacter auburnensis]
MKRFLGTVLVVLLLSARLLAQGNEFALARQYAANGEHDKALELYDKLFKQDPEAYYSFYLNSLFEVKKFDAAEAAAKKMVKQYPKNIKYYIALGSVYAKKGDAEKAKAVYEDLLKNLPASAPEISNLASLFYQGGNTDYAIKTFLQGRKKLGKEDLFANELITLYRYKRDKENITEEFLNFLPANPGYLAQAQYTLSTVYEDDADYDLLRTALLKRIQKAPDQTVFINMLTWMYMQQKEYDQALNQALALSRRTNSDGSDVYDLCRTLVIDEAYDTAIRGYEFIISKGKSSPWYTSAKIELIDAKNLKVTTGKYVYDDLIGLEKDYLDLLNELGRTQSTTYAMQRLARLQAFKLHKLDDAQKILEEATAIPNLRKELLASCKLDLGDVYLLNNQPWEATLLYSQVEKDNQNTNAGQDAKFRNAKFSYYTGDFEFAKGQLTVLKSATSQLIANDALNLSLLVTDNLAADSAGNALKVYARADKLIFAEQPEKAMVVLDSINVLYPDNILADDISMAKARIYIQQKNYNEAITHLKKIYTEHPTDLWADDAVYMVADIYDNQLNDKEQAKALYQKIITDYAGSLWINDARKRFRILRGDNAENL